MNALTVNLRQIADLQIQSAYLKPVLGAYELVFPLRFSVHGVSDGKWSATLEGVRVKVTGASAGELGFARPDVPLRIETMATQVSAGADFVLPLSPSQLSALEDIREAGDLTFELNGVGHGRDLTYGDCPVDENWRLTVSRSDWIERLSRSGARDILLVEVPLPFSREDG